MINLRKLYARRLAAGASGRRTRPLAITRLEDRVQPAAPIQFFYLPLPEQPTLAALEAIGNGSQGNDMTSLTSITTTESGSTVYYDQWEDGYETNLANPTQSTTQIWGDGNNANGVAPGFANDPLGIPAGTVLALRNDIPANPRVPANLFFDGGDRIGADKTVAISRAQFPVTGGSVIGATVETRDTRYYDTDFTSPVGTNTPSSSNMFQYAQLFVMAAQDNTTVQIDADNDGTFEQTVVLNQGQNALSANNILQGARVHANKPVQVDLVTGPINSAYAARTYALYSDNQLANDYFTPVGLTSGVDDQSVSHTDPVWLFVYNPSTTATITVEFETHTTSGTVATLAPGASGRFVVPADTGTRLFTTGGERFAALGTHDAGGTTHDWGFSLQAISALSQIAVVGLGVGDSNGPPTSGTSPIWVTAARLSGAAVTSRVYVDYDGNPATGALVDPFGNRYDVHFDLDRLQAQRVADPDHDSSGMRLYTLDGSLISTAWGEGPTARSGSPGFDAGTTVPAMAVPEFYKFVDFAPGGDLNGDGYYNSGDRLRYTFRIRNIGSDPIATAVLTDALPTAFVTYVLGTSTVDYGSGLTGIPDDLIGTAFPLDVGGYSVSPISVGSTIYVSFDVTVNGGLPAGTTTITNGGTLAYDVFNLPASVDLSVRGTIGDTVYRDDDGNGTQNGAEPGIAGVTVRLVRDLNGNGVIDGGEPVVDTQTTDSNGRYRFIDLVDDNYIVDVTDTGGVLTGGNLTGGPDPRPVTLGAGAIVDTADFGYQFSADLSLAKTVNNATANVGTNVTFTITVSNAGPVTASGVTVRDLLPSGVQYVSDNSGGAYNSGTGIWTIGSIANGGTATLQITATVLATGSYTNYAQVMTSGNPDPDSTPGDNSTTQDDDDSVTLTPTPVADLSLTKIVDNAAPAVGTNVTFTIVLTNNGPSAATGIQVSDVLPAGLTFVSSSDATYNPALGDNIWNIASLASGATATLTIVARVRLASGGPITNYTQVTGVNELDPDSTPNNGPQLPDEDDDASVTLTPTAITVGDTVYYDVNGNGTQNAGEPGIAGVTVTLTYLGANGVLGGGDDEVFTGVTNASGTYFITDLPAGNYITSTSGLPAGATTQTQGLASFTLITNTNRNDIDFGFRGVGSIGDRIFLDVNNNGIYDAGEGLDGVTVTLTGDLTGDGTPDTLTAVTGSDGLYQFTNLRAPAGGLAYTVAVVTAGLPRDGANAPIPNTTDPDLGLPNQAAVTISDDFATDDTQDFGYQGLGSVGDRIFLDVNGDNAWNPGEGLANVTVTISADVDGDGIPESFTATTDADGFYQFSNLPVNTPAGNPIAYTVTVNPAGLPGVTPSVDLDGTATPNAATFDLTANPTRTDADFGYRGPGTIGDRIFLDVNGDNAWNAGEGLATVTVTLTGDVDGDGLPETFTAVTDADGFYQFTNLPAVDRLGNPLTYTVSVATAGLPRDGANNPIPNAIDPDAGVPNQAAVTLNAVTPTSDTQDFGYRGPGSVGDRVFLDVNGDGVWNAGEGLANVTVTLTGDVDGDGIPESFTVTTDADGGYLISNLPVNTPAGNPITYTATVGAGLPGVAPSSDLDGTGTPSAATFNLTGNPTRTDVDFGYQGPGSIGDRVFLDLDGDGIYDPGEGITGVTVTLTGDVDGDGIPETFTAVTDADGGYLFSNLPVTDPADNPISYTVTVSPANLPTGVAPSTDLDGTPDNTTTFTLATNPTRTDVDFGYQGTGTMGDRVWVDADGNGLQGPTGLEPGLPAVGLTLTFAGQDGVFGTADDITTDVTTDANGNYNFARLPAGTFRVALDPATLAGNLTPTFDADGTGTANTADLTLTTGQSRTDADFGLVGNASLGGGLYIDQNRDGIQQPTEPGIPNATVQATSAGADGTFGTADDFSFTTTTAADGSYVFTGLPVFGGSRGVPGSTNYRAQVTALPTTGLTLTDSMDDGVISATNPVVVAVTDSGANQNRRDVKFGYDGVGSLSGTVLRDANNNGVLDAGDAGIAGVVLTLVGTDLFGNPVLDPLTGQPYQVTTDANGNYTFGTVVPGTYRVIETQPAGFLDNPETAGSNGGDTSTNDVIAAIPVGPGQVLTGYNFSEILPATVSGEVYNDRNRNHRRDPFEPGIANVIITLTGTDDRGNPVRITTTSDANGTYTFPNLRPGTYTLTQTQPVGFAQGWNTIGTIGGQFGATDVIGTIVVAQGQTGVSYQFGEVLQPATAATVPPLVPDPTKQQFLSSTGQVPTSPLLPTAGPNAPSQFVVTADGPGGQYVRVFDVSTGTERFRFTPFPGFTGGMRAAVGDVTGDGVQDIVVGAGAGGGPQVIIYDGNTGAIVRSFFAFESVFAGGVFVETGDFNFDGRNDVVVSADRGGGPRVRVFSGGDPNLVLSDFWGIDDPNFRGGARIATGDIDGDGIVDLVVSAGAGGGPRVSAYNGAGIAIGQHNRLFGDFFAFESTLTNGAYVTVGDVNGDGFGDLIAGSGEGGAPRVTSFSGQSLLSGGHDWVGNFFAFNPSGTSGVRVSAIDLDLDGKTELFVGTGPDELVRTRFVDPSTGELVEEFTSNWSNSTHGVFVG